jgi:DNA-binding NarL/FixJ family response regulator
MGRMPMEYMNTILGTAPVETGNETVMDTPNLRLPMRTLLLCNDVQFTGTTRSVLNHLQVTPGIVGNYQQALRELAEQEFEVIVVDWREVDNLGEFLSEVRRSKKNHESVLVAIVRDLLDLRQAFAAGVHFLIHKPASTLQIERCMRAAYAATVVRRRKHHREPVNILALASKRDYPSGEVTIVNLGEGGAGVRLHGAEWKQDSAVHVRVAEDIDLRFTLPGSDAVIHSSGRVIWSAGDAAGIRFTSIPESDRLQLESWLTECVEHSLAEMQERLRAACA